jgi:hypothetical protein
VDVALAAPQQQPFAYATVPPRALSTLTIPALPPTPAR